MRKAAEVNAPIVFAEDVLHLHGYEAVDDKLHLDVEHVSGSRFKAVYSLTGLCQTKNILTVLAAVDELKAAGYDIPDEAIIEGLSDVQGLTGLAGRWQKISEKPDIIIDTAHNAHGVRLLAQQLKQCRSRYDKIHIVWGMSNDKYPELVVPLLPSDAKFYFTQASVGRAMPAAELYDIGQSLGLECHFYPTVTHAFDRAKKNASPNDLIFIGGSNFVIAEIL